MSLRDSPKRIICRSDVFEKRKHPVDVKEVSDSKRHVTR